jgi:hypothetical protein
MEAKKRRITHGIPNFFAPHLSAHRAILGAGNLLFFIELTKQIYL